MEGLLLPCCSIFFSVLLCLVYFSKKRINLLENNMYSIMIISILLDGIVVTILHAYGLGELTPRIMENISFLNKLDFIFLMVYMSCLFIYISIITIDKVRKKSKTLIKVIILIDVVFAIFLALGNVKVISQNGNYSVAGTSTDLAAVICGLYILSCILVILTNLKKVDKRHIPIAGMIAMILFLIIIFQFNPYLIVISISLTFLNYIMYFTIENPDLQMLREFHKAREHAEESNNEKTSFLLDMSNKIKAPITDINNLTNDALNQDDIEVIKENIRSIKHSTLELNQMVNNVLDISELESRQIQIRKTKYNVYNLFTVVNKACESKIDKKVEYRFHYDKTIPEYLYGDSIRLKQIMNTILENSIEYTKEGFIELNVNSIMKHDICRLIITIEDSGIGMTAEEQSHLFDKEKIYSDEVLKTIDSTKNNLGVVKSLVNLMGGTIMVNSEYGKGSKFTIVVDQKVKEEKTKIIETVEKYEEIYEHHKKIMLVINSEELSKKINKILKKEEYDIVEVKGGQACLERLRDKQKFDLILMEEKLEKLSSEDTLNKKKDTPGYKIPIILISDNKGFGAKEMYQEKGFKDVIFTPIKKEQVLEAIKNNLEN